MSIPIPPLLQELPVLSALFTGRLDTPLPSPERLLTEFKQAGGKASRLVTARQIHSSRVLEVESATPPGSLNDEGDALVTRVTGVALGIRTADCLPIIVIDPGIPALAVVHAGWRGTAAGILACAIEKMVAEYGAVTQRVRVGAGPGARSCCYEVSSDVAGSFGPEALVRQDSGSVHLDLVTANRQQAMNTGVPAGNFEAVEICSICSPDECHSYRRDGASAGRMWALAALKPEPTL